MTFGLLDPSCADFVNQTIYARPFYGWGWSRNDEKAPSDNSEVPAPFGLRVVRLVEHKSYLNGFIGRVEEPQHPLDGLWAIAYLRHVGHYDLVSSIPHTNIFLGPHEPFLIPSSDDPKLEEHYRNREKEPLYPLWRFSGSPQLGGYAFLAASREIYEEKF